MKTIIVTGASFGIGEAISKSLAPEFNIIACARRKDKLDSLALSSQNIIPFELDITDSSSIQNLIDSIDGDIYGLINCAGGGGGPMKFDILEEEQEFLDKSFNLNVSSTFNLIKAIAPKMKRSHNPIVINITSIAGEQIFRCSSAYTISKHAQSVMSKILRRDLSAQGIRMTEVLPGSVNSHRQENENSSIMPEDIADAISFIVKSKGSVNVNAIYISHLLDIPFLS